MSTEKETVTTIHGDIISIEEAIQRFDISPIVKRFNTWVVTTYGIECLSNYYPIASNRVFETDWLSHMGEKGWVIQGDFMNALFFARGVQERKTNYLKSGEPLKLFLCHANEDKPAIRDIYNQLIVIGVQPWLDEEDILPGKDWPFEIKKAVQNSDVVIVFLSRNSVGKTGFFQKEIKIALDAADERPEGKIFIIPAKLEDCDVPDRLSNKQWVDLYTENGFDRLLQSLIVCAQD